MSNGDDEPESDDDGADAPREDDGATDQPSAEEIGAAESSTASDDDETAKEIAAGKDSEETEGDADDAGTAENADAAEEVATTEKDDSENDSSDEPPGEADADDQLEADEEQAEKAEESAESGDDADVEPPDDAEENGDEASDDEGGADEDDPGSHANEDTEDAGDAESADDTDEGGDTADEDGDTADETDATDTDEGGDGDEGTEDAMEPAEEHTVESIEKRLDSTGEQIEQAETEAQLDRAETSLDEIEADIEAADLPDAEEGEGGDDDGDDDDGDEDEETEAPQERLESRVTELRETIEEKRGPYAEEVIEEVEGARTTIEETRWTERGRSEVLTAVSTFLDAVEEPLGESFSAGESVDDQPPILGEVIDAIENADLDPDEDTETIASLLSAAEELVADLEEAEEWDDLTVRQKLDAEGFYSVLTPENRKDFPPEWNAIKLYERRGEVGPILLALDMLGSEFMDGHCIESLKRMGAPEAYDAMEQRAQRRDKAPIEVLGKIGDERALETLHEYIEGESDPALQKVTLKAIGEIGSEDSTQAVADRLVAENDTVRSTAARALGLIGDTRAISPLADVLEDDDSDSVRASAAWSLNRIGTENALDAAREHENDRSYLVQSEAERAASAVTDDEKRSSERPA